MIARSVPPARDVRSRGGRGEHVLLDLGQEPLVEGEAVAVHVAVASGVAVRLVEPELDGAGVEGAAAGLAGTFEEAGEEADGAVQVEAVLVAHGDVDLPL